MSTSDTVFVDTNVLIYASLRDAPHHIAARSTVTAAFDGRQKLCFSSQILAEYYSVITNTRRVSKPRSAGEAIRAIQSLLDAPGFELIPTPDNVVELWMKLINRHPVTGKDVFDLQIVATMNANQVSRICTFNRKDFEKFDELEVLTPS